jgi:hypothetical protein
MDWLFKTRDMLSRGAGKVVFRSPWPVLQQAYNFNFWFARLNVAAGAADASRAMLRTSCRKVELLTSIFAFL